MRFSPYTSKPMCVHESPLDLAQHENAVAEIATRVRRFHDEKVPFRIFHGSTNSTRHNVLDKAGSIDTSHLDRVLRIDSSRATALVEPNVPMDRLVEATLRYGLVPAVVTEFPGITVGGAYAGTAGESSSFKHGFFDRIVLEVEVVLANGEIVQISEQQHADLFRSMSSTMGTLGITTALEIRLEKAKRYVQTTYTPVKSMEEAVAILQQETVDPDNNSKDYVDGIMYSKNEGVIITGKSVDEPHPGTRIRRFSRPWDPWFYIHVQNSTRQAPDSIRTEAIPIAEYLFRYDRGGFWVGRSAFSYFYFPFNRFTRWFLDDFLHTRMLYRALHASKTAISYVVQDCALPYKTACQFVEYTDEEFGIYPLWLCPLRQTGCTTTFHPRSSLPPAEEMAPQQMLNIGLWGFGPKEHSVYISANRALERKLLQLGGMKWLYAQTYYDESEFWKIYQRDWYDKLRTKYHASYLPNVWQKVRVDVKRETLEIERSWRVWGLGVWPVAGIFGLCKAMWSGEWRIPRRVRIDEMTGIRDDVD